MWNYDCFGRNLDAFDDILPRIFRLNIEYRLIWLNSNKSKKDLDCKELECYFRRRYSKEVPEIYNNKSAFDILINIIKNNNMVNLILK